MAIEDSVAEAQVITDTLVLERWALTAYRLASSAINQSNAQLTLADIDLAESLDWLCGPIVICCNKNTCHKELKTAWMAIFKPLLLLVTYVGSGPPITIVSLLQHNYPQHHSQQSDWSRFLAELYCRTSDGPSEALNIGSNQLNQLDSLSHFRPLSDPLRSFNGIVHSAGCALMRYPPSLLPDLQHNKTIISSDKSASAFRSKDASARLPGPEEILLSTMDLATLRVLLSESIHRLHDAGIAIRLPPMATCNCMLASPVSPTCPARQSQARSLKPSQPVPVMRKIFVLAS
ncbi:unnamed protein product [Protopolystoma xenopodis]|uniref:Uncharacterized protein n=1 Tax=Protopolystoma xenopodis TaxID=117903 RepID=A0A3S4ZN10_9PLAT|nr:unnamed protein product [Protopolystoma xenopodis]